MGRAVTIEAPVWDTSNQNDLPTELVGYIRAMLQELQAMTPPEAGLMLPYLIDMARQEAEQAETRMAVVGRQ